LTEPEIVTDPSVNWSSFLNQVKRDYETPPAMGIAHGLQKDAIQNGWGARKHDKGSGWSFAFRLIEKPDGSYLLTMTDHGTTGLIGRIFDQNCMKLPENIPQNEKLARFESMFDSGGGIGPGLFGRGKLLFNCASNQKRIIYDSLTLKGKYRLGYRRIIGRDFEQYRRILEDDIAKQKLAELTGLQPLDRCGTRIIIVNPIGEVVDAIHDGTFLKAIEETWWEIIKKYNASITVTDENGYTSVAKIPHEFYTLPKNKENGWRPYYRKNIEVQIHGRVYRIKHLHLLVPPAGHTLRSELRGVWVHRRGMKVGMLQLSEIPDQIRDRFFGYVQLNPGFEELISEAENVTHYGFASRRDPAYRELRRTTQQQLDLFMKKLGFRSTQKEENERSKRILNEAKAELDSILNSLGVPGFGSGIVKTSDLSISVIGLNFPGGSNYVSFGDVISGFKYKLKNKSNQTKTVFVEVFTHGNKANPIETLLTRTKIKVKNRYETKELTINIKQGIYPRGKRIGCTLQVTDEKQSKLCERTFYFFVELPFEPSEEKVSLILSSAVWPRYNSRRVDFGQKISNLLYEIENLTSLPLKLKLKAGTIWAEERERIDTVSETILDLSPFENNQLVIDEVSISEEKYSEVGRGKMFLRCHAVALEDSQLWEKGERLAESNVSFYLNMDPRYGFFEDPVYSKDGPLKPRSQAEPVEGLQRWQIRINSTHPAYIDVLRKDEIAQRNYLFEELARQTIYVLLHKNQNDVIRKITGITSIDELDNLLPDEVLRNIAYPTTDRILSEYYGG